MAEWKALLLVYPKLDLRLNIGRKCQRFDHCAAEQEIGDALQSFSGFPDLVRELTSGAATIRSEVVEVQQPMHSLTIRAPNEFWPSPNDTRGELDQFAPAGRFDSLFIFWPQHDFARGDSVPGTAWGLGMGASEWSNGATYAAVANATSSAWNGEARGEVWLHEWLHGVCHHFARRGFVMPERDADGAELHGYTRSPIHGWCDYYRDLMSGNVLENGQRLGIPRNAWG
ncbi:MAG: hypothetical protein JO354_11565 [Verrucomicrobia bacterium]|nr:hypothetical protein [Verrucomicrobiota bacterium]